VAVEELPRVEGVPEHSYAALAGRYGYAAHEVLALAAERGELAQPIVPGLPDLLAEAVLAARREQARSVADVLLRRTRLWLLAAHELDGAPPGGSPPVGLPAGGPSPGGAPPLGAPPQERADRPPGPVRRVADVLAGELGWSEQRTTEEIERFAQEARAEGFEAG
jgi:glycerol-3-phosphate dehydrogenase